MSSAASGAFSLADCQSQHVARDGIAPVTRPLQASLHHRGRWDGSTIVFCFSIGLLLLIVGYPLLWLLMSAFGIPGEFELGYIAHVYTRSQNLAPLVNTLI